MSKADDYRRRAAECLTMARGSTNKQSQKMLLHMADVWIKLAELAEERPGHPTTTANST
jgi:hypothetical protein